jgi:hypothetical protein
LIFFCKILSNFENICGKESATQDVDIVLLSPLGSNNSLMLVLPLLDVLCYSKKKGSLDAIRRARRAT